ncbi:hypothetical protein C8R47DRAFT_992846 [Mycena vitilis]|nr:hypothetical protein C8R47DRAFT_992846 [Mycena vitilis]
MGSLHREYLAPRGDSVGSTFAALSLLVPKKRLAREDIYDRGVAWRDAPARFHLAPTFLSRIDRVVGEMQTFLERAAGLVDNRSSHFVIDPEDSCLPLLRGSSDLFQLEAAWDILRARLERGHTFFLKYTEEFQLGEEAPTSPSSTALGLHEELRAFRKPDERLRSIFHDFPHHSTSLSSEARHALIHGGSWNKVVTLDPGVQEAFPHRSAEERPFVVYYDKDGGRTQALASSLNSPPNPDDVNVTKLFHPERRRAAASLICPAGRKSAGRTRSEDSRTA